MLVLLWNKCKKNCWVKYVKICSKIGPISHLSTEYGVNLSSSFCVTLLTNRQSINASYTPTTHHVSVSKHFIFLWFKELTLVWLFVPGNVMFSSWRSLWVTATFIFTYSLHAHTHTYTHTLTHTEQKNRFVCLSIHSTIHSDLQLQHEVPEAQCSRCSPF